MEVKNITVVLEGIDIRDPSQEQIASDKFKEEMEKQGFIPTDNLIVLRDGKMTSIRAVEIGAPDEEAEIYAFSKVIEDKEGNVKTVVSMKIV